MTSHCCDEMARQLAHRCPLHDDPADCPESLVAHLPGPDLYLLRVHDGGTGAVRIAYCPWCGADLARDRQPSPHPF